jgi:hypothetical protein
VIRTVTYASYGTPNGSCGAFSNSSCHAPDSQALVASACIGLNSCSVPANNSVFGDPCFGTGKRLYIQATCGSALTNPVTSGIIAQYSARQGTSVAQDQNGYVSAWNDISGNGNHLTYNGSPPIYNPTLINGIPALDFSGGAGMYSAGNFALNDSVTVFIVTQWRSPGTWGSLAHHGSRDNDWAMEENAGMGQNFVHWQTNNDNAGVNLTLSSGTNFVLAGRMDPTKGRYFSAASTSGGVTSITGSASTSLSTGSKRLYVGKSDANEGSNAYIGEIIYYNRSLSDAERDSVISYLRSAWGI